MICAARGFALLARLEHDEETAGIGGGVPVAAGLRAEALDVRIAGDDVVLLAHQLHHLVGRDRLRGFGETLDDADILDREEALRNLHHHDAGQRHGGEEHAERDRLMAQHDVEGAPVARRSAPRNPPRRR